MFRVWHTPGSVMAPAVHFVASMSKHKAKALAAGRASVDYALQAAWVVVSRL
jgi:hypothetical protein